MPEAAISVFYLLLFAILIFNIHFFKKSGLGKWTLLLLFGVKVIAGVAYGLFYKLPKYYATADTWRFYRLSLAETDVLLKSPSRFVADLFYYGYDHAGNIFSGNNSYWNDLKSNVLVKLLAVVNVFTLKSYFADVIIFNFIFFVGLVCLFKVFFSIFTTKKKLVTLSVFLIPSTLFWCSGIHKDGLILSAIGVVVYCFHFKIFVSKPSIMAFATSVLCLLLIFTLRNFIALALAFAISTWAVSLRLKWRQYLAFIIGYILAVAVFFLTPYVFPFANLPSFLAAKQAEFRLLSGGSAIDVGVLQPTFSSFVTYFPTALDMAFFRPHISEATNPATLLAFLELVFILLLLLLLKPFKRKGTKLSPIILFLLFFSVSVLLIEGYTITFSGAIVRYRSLVLPFIITPLLCFINFEDIYKWMKAKVFRPMEQ